jgi:hypothetical protein
VGGADFGSEYNGCVRTVISCFAPLLTYTMDCLRYLGLHMRAGSMGNQFGLLGGRPRKLLVGSYEAIGYLWNVLSRVGGSV